MNKKKRLSSICNASIPTIRRLPLYLNIVREAYNEGKKVISGTVIAQELNLEPIQVRKDLATTGIIGKPRVGYNLVELIKALEDFLHWDKHNKTILVGAGSLGSALLGYGELKKAGMNIIAAFDSNPSKIGTRIHNIPVYDIEEAPEFLKENPAKIAVMTLPADSAQRVADLITEAGIKVLWNFSARKLKVADDILVQKETLSSGYAVLSVLSSLEE